MVPFLLLWNKFKPELQVSMQIVDIINLLVLSKQFDWNFVPKFSNFITAKITTIFCYALHYTPLYSTMSTLLHCTTLPCTTLPCATLPCTALHCTALHCTALHCTALHCKNTPNFHFFFIVLKGSLSCYFTKQIFGVFHYLSHHGQAEFFFCTLVSLSSVFEPNNQVCVLGVINERYEALCSDNKQVGTKTHCLGSNIQPYRLIFCPQVEKKKYIVSHFLEKIVLITRIEKKCFWSRVVEHTSPYKNVCVQSNGTANSSTIIKLIRNYLCLNQLLDWTLCSSSYWVLQ